MLTQSSQGTGVKDFMGLAGVSGRKKRIKVLVYIINQRETRAMGKIKGFPVD